MATNKNPSAEVAGANGKDDEDSQNTRTVLSGKARQRQTVAAVLGLLAERWPQAFSIYEARRKPLKIGIHHEIQAALKGAITDTELATALSVYTGNERYQKKLCRVGTRRIGLDGAPAGVVTPEQANYAKFELSQMVHTRMQRQSGWRS